MKPRILSVLLPYFPTERHTLAAKRRTQNRIKPWWDQGELEKNKKPKEGPLVLVTQSAKGARLSALSNDAEELGLWREMKLSDARAMAPDIKVIPHDHCADSIALEQLARWLQRYSPSIMIYDVQTILLDIAGCDHLFGGENAMLDDVTQRLNSMGMTVQCAIADTIGAALALARFSNDDMIKHNSHIQVALDHLPVEALRLDDDTIVVLKRLGLKCIGDVRKIPRAALELRFGQCRIPKVKRTKTSQSLQRRLDQLSGCSAEPFIALNESPDFRTQMSCIESVLDHYGVEIVFNRLITNLVEILQRHNTGARQFCLTGYKSDGTWSETRVCLSQADRSKTRIKRLFRDKFQHIDCGFGIDLFTLDALQIESVDETQSSMTHNEHGLERSISDYSDTISNRFGSNSVMCFAPVQSHVPERAQIPIPVTYKTDWKAVAERFSTKAPRPLRLFQQPEPADVTAELPDRPPVQFIWRHQLRRVIRARGPERILPEWWKDEHKSKQSAVFRDYYDVEDENGIRYWLFRSTYHDVVTDDCSPDDKAPIASTHIRQQWFVHGLF